MTNETECSSCNDSQCSAHDKKPGEQDAEFIERQAIAARMCRIKHKLVVLSGKGGVGKSTVAVNLAVALSMAGKKVGLLDVDIHGPSVPRLLDIEGAKVEGTETSIFPVKAAEKLSVMSIGLLLQGKDEAVIWRGPRKYGAIKQFIKDVEWDDLDYLIIDSPPGTGDEPLSVIQLIEQLDGAIVVTTPQGVAVQDVRRSIMFCRELHLPVVGVIENLSGFICPNCSEKIDIFTAGGGESMAKDMGVPFLGAIPIDPQVVAAGDAGKPTVQTQPHSETSLAFGRVVRSLLEPEIEAAQEHKLVKPSGATTKIAVPVAKGSLCMHFGHCEQFAVFEVNPESKTIQGKQMLTPPPHEPGVFPKWLSEQGAQVIISGGMGTRAQSLFTDNNIQVIVGAQANDPQEVVEAYLDGNLQTGANICDH
jgi:ATP-binding protein involved in chromosome partitioning